MFILYAVVIGLVVGLALGGRPAGLATLKIRWSWLILGGLFAQVVLFSGPIVERIGDLGAPIYVVTTGAVLFAVIANWRIAGLPIVAAGAACNFAAILANGGYMPADAGALAAVAKVEGSVYSNSTLLAHPALAPLTDIFAIPRGIPFANVFSVGDLLIGLGIAVVIATALRRAPAAMDHGDPPVNPPSRTDLPAPRGTTLGPS